MDSLRRRIPDGEDPYRRVPGAPGRAVAQEWGVGAGAVRAGAGHAGRSPVIELVFSSGERLQVRAARLRIWCGRR